MNENRMQTQSRGTVRLTNAVFYAHHGVMQEEHRIGGRYEVDVAMGLDFTKAGETDDLDATVADVGHGVRLGEGFWRCEERSAGPSV